MPISLESTHVELGWPAPREVTHPRGAGAAVYASMLMTSNRS
jgi:hypothetical protein